MNDYSNLLDRVYELEGLLHLAVNRSNPPASLDSLIRRKAAEITACLGQIDEPLEVAADDDAVVADDNESAESVDATDVDSPAEEFDTDNDPTEYVEDYVDDYEYADSEVLDDENGTSDNETENDEAGNDMSDDAESGVSDSDIPRKFSFSINDRFRFRRTLFNNSDREFNIAIASISACHDYQEAEQMLQEDYGWNTEDVEPSDFLRLVSNYFKYQR